PASLVRAQDQLCRTSRFSINDRHLAISRAKADGITSRDTKDQEAGLGRPPAIVRYTFAWVRPDAKSGDIGLEFALTGRVVCIAQSPGARIERGDVGPGRHTMIVQQRVEL